MREKVKFMISPAGLSLDKFEIWRIEGSTVVRNVATVEGIMMAYMAMKEYQRLSDHNGLELRRIDG